MTATSALETARREATAILDQLDTLIGNRLAADSPEFAGWMSARHIERYGRTKKRAGKAGESQEAAPLTKADDHAA